MSWIDTNKLDAYQLRKQMMWNLVDLIEDKLGVMAHEIPELRDVLKDYQDQKIKPLYFYNYLTKFFDEVNK